MLSAIVELRKRTEENRNAKVYQKKVRLECEREIVKMGFHSDLLYVLPADFNLIIQRNKIDQLYRIRQAS